MIKVFNWLFNLHPIQFLQGIMIKVFNWLFNPTGGGKFLQGIGYPITLGLLCILLAQCAHADDSVIVCKEFKPGEISCIIAGTISDITPPSESI